MKIKHNIESVFKKLARKPGSLRDQQLMHPEREWAVGLVVSVFLFLLAASVSVYIYYKNQTINVEVAADDTEKTVYRESLVKEALVIINSREEKLRSLNQELVPTEVDVTESATTQPQDAVSAASTTLESE